MTMRALCLLLLAAPSGQDPDPHTIPFELKNHIILVKAEVNGKGPYTLVFDSGASETILTPDTAKALELKTEPAGNGMDAATVDSVSAGGAAVKNLRLLVWDPPQAAPLKQLGIDYHGILGYSFLSEFLITLDYRAKTITLRRHDAAPRASRAELHGAAVEKSKVVSVEKGSKAERAGLREGDDVYKVNGLSVDDAAEIAVLWTLAKPGDELRIGVMRGTERREIRLAK